MSETKLLPCPFCGKGNVYVWDDGTKHPAYKVVCPDCTTEGPEGGSRSAAIAFWSTRTPDPRIAAADAMAKALESIANGNNDTCAFDPVQCPTCCCPSCKARNALAAYIALK